MESRLLQRLMKPFFRIYLKVAPLLRRGKSVYKIGDFKMGLNIAESRAVVLRRFGLYEKDVSNILADILREGDVYVDIGSNKGYHCLEAASLVGETGKVFCFEADPKNFADLEYNIKLNEFSHIEAFNKAVYHTSGEVELQRGNTTAHSTIVGEAGDFTIESIRLDDFLNNSQIRLEDIGLIKIDVEGSEMGVLSGMKRILGDLQDTPILVELHPEEINKEELYDFITEQGLHYEEVGSGFYILINPPRQEEHSKSR
ncbi:MAG: FkbM family methyltransferase [Candidatus Nanohaloarchaea archaeon]|nr:FkbM family methyltransferase [Candidatus Nanohaloarchaea archaeon]